MSEPLNEAAHPAPSDPGHGAGLVPRKGTGGKAQPSPLGFGPLLRRAC